MRPYCPRCLDRWWAPVGRVANEAAMHPACREALTAICGPSRTGVKITDRRAS